MKQQFSWGTHELIRDTDGSSISRYTYNDGCVDEIIWRKKDFDYLEQYVKKLA